MIDLDVGRTRRLREAAADLRARALAVDAAPTAMADHLDAPAVRLLRQLTTPAEHRDGSWPDAANEERVAGLLELARGDAAALLALPGPALAGVVVDVLGDHEQRTRFHDRLADGRTWTFFAMTEPERGADTAAIGALLKKAGGEYRLHGRKRYIANGARGAVGVVFARTGPSPQSIRAVLVELPAPGLAARRLDTVGLRGACLSELVFDGFRVTEEQVLGRHLPHHQRGLWGALRTFNLMRVQVAALALGTAYAIHDEVTSVRPDAPDRATVAARLAATRRLVLDAAAHADKDAERAYLPSVAKLASVPLAFRTSRWAATSLGPAGLLEHPLVEKWTRDVRAFEAMESTTNLQRLRVAQDYLEERGDG